ncbi:hypothetical protein GUITHDRAFT_152478 [Guillardia theta CCMP2712]|uniref:BZIP domain-containing protein n=1 Tax=Guillardia theta (strain CCMP2712) TaxID=905079 RepID=L1JE18_GUITC|nr:hypothetical protein GUITHDRAFT_152478 [Guillardia theta CCMP2712]EKX46340.1 hypothetical protein GUITHDRAFT_152478 [Guillardia theta CCMP2712]|eukprot:XP_005833320.1 hypothetical protein GUITHDRAFT_152478 [Guillardia theta CCMP2712]
MAKEIKTRVRTIKNRLAAKKSRDQARTYVQKLEANLATLASQNEAMAQRLALMESENENLRTENEVLKKKAGFEASDATPDFLKSLVKGGADVSAVHSGGGQPIHLAALFGTPSVAAPPVVDDHVEQHANESVISMQIKERFGLTNSSESDKKTAEMEEAAEHGATLEVWRREKRRRQNREAQRRHRERQLCQQSRDLSNRCQLDGFQGSSSWMGMSYSGDSAPINAPVAAPVPAPVDWSMQHHAHQSTPMVQHSSFAGVVQHEMHHEAQPMNNYIDPLMVPQMNTSMFDVNSFPVSLSRSSSLGNLTLSRQSSLGNMAKDVDEMWQGSLPFDEVKL